MVRHTTSRLLMVAAMVILPGCVDRKADPPKTLPPGVVITPYYDRTLFVSQVMYTVRNNLLEGGLLVIAVLFLFLGDLRVGVIVASATPLLMLIAFTGMMQAGLSGNLMSLGAIDFGLLVDGSVVLVDNILRRLSRTNPQRPEDRLAEVLAAGREVMRPMTHACGGYHHSGLHSDPGAHRHRG